MLGRLDLVEVFWFRILLEWFRLELEWVDYLWRKKLVRYWKEKKRLEIKKVMKGKEIGGRKMIERNRFIRLRIRKRKRRKRRK